MTATAAPSFKQKAHELIDQLPDTANWEDLADAATKEQDIQLALDDVAAGRVVDGDEVLEWIESWGTEAELSPPEVKPRRSPRPG